MDLRKLVDLTPWDKNGYSWMGLNREQSKFIATILIFTGLFFADPPFSILPFDFMNIWLAGGISQHFGIKMGVALLLTYTVIAWGLFFIGVWIYPYDSKRLISGYITRFKKFLKEAINKPLYMVFGISMFYLIYRWYNKSLDPITLLNSSSVFLTEPTMKTLLYTGLIIFVLVLISKRKK